MAVFVSMHFYFSLLHFSCSAISTWLTLMTYNYTFWFRRLYTIHNMFQTTLQLKWVSWYKITAWLGFSMQTLNKRKCTYVFSDKVPLSPIKTMHMVWFFYLYSMSQSVQCKHTVQHSLNIHQLIMKKHQLHRNALYTFINYFNNWTEIKL